MFELKKCPFCGFDASIAVSKELGVCVKCTNILCRCQTFYASDDLSLFGNWPYGNALNKVIDRWNNRSCEKE